MSYEFMNTINMHLEDQRIYDVETEKLEKIKQSEKRERILYGIAFVLVLLAVFILDTPH